MNKISLFYPLPGLNARKDLSSQTDEIRLFCRSIPLSDSVSYSLEGTLKVSIEQKNALLVLLRRVRNTLLVVCFLISTLTACTRSASKAKTVTVTNPVPNINIDRVEVNDNNGIYVTGRSTIPAGECVQTELLSNHTIVKWWPRDVCIQIDAGKWEILVALGQNGAPANLPRNVDYEIHAWWPKNPTQISVNFPFDLNGPKQPTP